MQLGFHARLNALVDEEERMVLLFRQFIRCDSLFHIVATYKRESTTNI